MKLSNFPDIVVSAFTSCWIYQILMTKSMRYIVRCALRLVNQAGILSCLSYFSTSYCASKISLFPIRCCQNCSFYPIDLPHSHQPHWAYPHGNRWRTAMKKSDWSLWSVSPITDTEQVVFISNLAFTPPPHGVRWREHTRSSYNNKR